MDHFLFKNVYFFWEMYYNEYIKIQLKRKFKPNINKLRNNVTDAFNKCPRVSK